MPSNNSVVLKVSGLQTFINYFDIPQGALLKALNTVIDRDQIIEPRRGFTQYGAEFGSPTDRVKQLITYKGTVLRHAIDNLQYDSDSAGTFVSFSGDTVDQIDSGTKIKSIEQNSNLYFTSLTGVKKISAKTASDFPNVSVQAAGGVKALDLSGIVSYSQPGFLLANYNVAYRVVWGITDINGNLVLGSPSNRLVVYNVASTSGVVTLTFAKPADVTSTDYFYQIYRTAIFDQSSGAIDPGDEQYLVLENNWDGTSTSITVTDVTPESFRASGALLYTNPNSGEGILQANEKPPFAKDIALYKGYSFLGNTSTVQRLSISNLSVQNLISGTSTITISNGTTSTTYGVQGSQEQGTIDLGSSPTNYYNSTPGPAKYILLASANNDRTYCFYFVTNATNDLVPSVTGTITEKVDLTATPTPTIAQIKSALLLAMDTTADFNVADTGGSTASIAWANNGAVTTPIRNPLPIVGFTSSVTQSGTGEDVAGKKIFLPRVPTGVENGPSTAQQIEQFSLSLVKLVNQNDANVYAYYTSGYNDLPGQLSFENRVVTGPAYYLYANSTLTGNEFNPALPATNTNTVVSTNEVKPNRLYYSKYQQPDAFPLPNYLDIGPQDKAIQRIIGLRDSLFVFKEDGIYRVSGDTAPFQLAPFDNSVTLTAPDTAAILNNQVYGLTTQGVISVSDTGVQVVSRPIENLVLGIQAYPSNYKTASFGLGYESDRAYLLWTTTNSTDTVATQCFRYNVFTNTWTNWDKSASAAVINFSDNKLYIGAGDVGLTEQERKTLSRLDYADRQYTLDILTDGVADTVLSLGTVGMSAIGDVLLQTQYLTINQFNRVLNMLDTDRSIIQHSTPNYFSTLEFKVGAAPRAQVVALAAKLSADPQIADSTYTAAVDNYVGTISSTTHTSSQVTLNLSGSGILANRYVTISGSNTTPSIDGTHQVVSTSGSSIVINAVITANGTAGNIQTAVNDFRDSQACFNIIVGKLNTSTNLTFKNYPTSSGSTPEESVITAVTSKGNLITVTYPIQYMAGPIVLYKAINCDVVYAPQYFGDPSSTKQVREGTVMFENKNFTNVTVAYASDLSPYFESTPFVGSGNGDFGQFVWSQQNWGGVAAPIPIRTLIPAQKQRCRFLQVEFTHTTAFEKFSIYGMSLVYRIVSSRGYR